MTDAPKNQTPASASSAQANPAHDLDEAALFYHRHPHPGKLGIQATKPLGNQRDLALAYSPGVAAPCLEIARDPSMAADYTARANLVAVISNGTAVLGLGAIGPMGRGPRGKWKQGKVNATQIPFSMARSSKLSRSFCEISCIK